ncbi:MAG: AMP-binding protein [Candidatus Thermoplasmatota archaeon]
MPKNNNNSNKQIPKEVEIPNLNLISLFRKNVEKNQNKPALYFKGKIKTYKKIEEEVNRLSNSLQDIGIKKQDRVAVLLPNCPQFYTTFLAVQSLGAIFVSFNPLYAPREIIQLLNDCQPKAMITLDIFSEKIKSIQKEINIENIIISSIAEELPSLKKYLYKIFKARKNPIIDNSLSYEKLIENGKNIKIKTKINPQDDIAVLQYTGGTTGEPKGAMLTHYNLVSQAVLLQKWKIGLESQPKGQIKVAAVLPFSHIFGLTSSFIWPIIMEAEIYLIPDPRKLLEIMNIIGKYKIHFLFGVPLLFQKLAAHKKIKKYDFSSIHVCCSGGEELPDETVKLFENKTNCLLIEGYGLTEASPVSHINPPNRFDRKIGSIGIPIPNTYAKIVKPDTNEEITDYNKKGELWVKGPGIMKGYWKNEKATNEAISKGWLKTGDVACKDETGYYKIVDRLKDVIIVSGFNVWPNEVEKILKSHPSIMDTAVISEKTSKGIIVKAILVKKDNCEEISLDEIREFCKKYLAPYKVPKIIEYTSEIPRSMVGKIMRRKLKNVK